MLDAENGDALRKSAYDSAWQRFISNAIKVGIVEQKNRFATHDLKRKGITDTKGNLHDKQHASGHRSPAMMDIYDLSMPLVKAPEDERNVRE
ncbi:integrase [Carnimonas bestiolae]|uniref:integrase n=1 Tax=Carnimonas bestiolae TaxID=3402172 RepID=UPI003F4ADAFE